jgi:hypothetical protein
VNKGKRKGRRFRPQKKEDRQPAKMIAALPIRRRLLS